MANKLEAVWEPIVAALKLTMPHLVPMITLALKAEKSSARVREEFNQTA